MKEGTPFESGKEMESKISKAFVSPEALDENIAALCGMAGDGITCEQWEEVLTAEEVIGNEDLVTSLHDHLLDHGNEIQTADELRAAIQKLKREAK